VEAELTQDTSSVKETIVSARACEAAATGPSGVELFTFVSEACGATGFSTGIARFSGAAILPYHRHGFSEAITIVEGRARVLLEGREYELAQRDCVHVPAGLAHQVENADLDHELVAHWAFATAIPTRELVQREYPVDNRGSGNPSESDPETIIRYTKDAVYELSKDTYFVDLFARRFGSKGICGGHGRFLPGASLPCHTHDFDESITIIRGRAVCLVQGRRYELSGCDTAFIPKGLPHRFLNLSEEEMAMVWVYAGSEPDRRIVDTRYCAGDLMWPGYELT
jgi:quercetin dioxygenase-like cupin family protein